MLLGYVLGVRYVNDHAIILIYQKPTVVICYFI